MINKSSSSIRTYQNKCPWKKWDRICKFEGGKKNDGKFPECKELVLIFSKWVITEIKLIYNLFY